MMLYWPQLFLLVTGLMVKIEAGKDKRCHQLFFVETSWTDRRPDVAVNMTFGMDGTILSHTVINKQIEKPVSAITLQMRDCNDGRVTTLYNITSRLCEYEQLMNRIPILKSLMQTSLAGSNYTLTCPMTRGMYVMRIRIDERNRLLGYIYRPNMYYILFGGLYDAAVAGGAQSGSLGQLVSEYNIVLRIIKRACTN